MSSVSSGTVVVDSGGGGDGGGSKLGGCSSNNKPVKHDIIKKSKSDAVEKGLQVPNKSLKPSRIPRKHTHFLVCVVIPVILSVLSTLPNGCDAGKSKKDSGSKNGNFTQSPTNHEEVSTRNKVSIAISGTPASDDYWVGSDKLEFKPHPLLLPSTQTPMLSQIPLPFFDIGFPSTVSPSLSSSEGGGTGAEVDDPTESVSDEEKKGKGKTRKSRGGGRKKSRDQRRLAHRTLWARQNAASNFTTTNAYVRAMQHSPYFLHNHHQIRQQSPVILTGGGGSMMSSQNPLLIPPLNSRTDDNFHGSATSWNINNPGSGIIAPNLIHSYLPQSSSHLQNSGGGTQVSSSSSSSSQESSQQQTPPFPPPSSSLQQYPFGYAQLQQQQRLLASQFAAHQQQQQQSQQISLQMPPLAQSQQSYQFMPSAPDYSFQQQQQQQQQSGSPVLMSGANGPVLVYVGAGGAGATQQGLGQIPSASGPIPVKPFNVNEIPGAGLPAHLQYNSISGPDISSAHQLHQPHFQSISSGDSGGNKNNPQYMRNNFIRMVMDKMANVGKLLPIPFVTKYSSSPSQTPPLQQGVYNIHGHFSRRMKK